jgi:hypothetical protein
MAFLSKISSTSYPLPRKSKRRSGLSSFSMPGSPQIASVSYTFGTLLTRLCKEKLKSKDREREALKKVAT